MPLAMCFQDFSDYNMAVSNAGACHQATMRMAVNLEIFANDVERTTDWGLGPIAVARDERRNNNSRE